MGHKPKKSRYQVGSPDQTKTLVIVPKFSSNNGAPTSRSQSSNGQDRDVVFKYRLEEAVGLAKAIELDVVSAFITPLKQAKPSTLFGDGKLEQILETIKQYKIELVIVDGTLTPIQQRNLERAWSKKVLDRTGLILEIFGKRAQTKEGRLQVELAHLEYQKSRLVRSWTHLERQRGGVGFLGGPGETQIEADRRQLQGRIQSLKNDLASVKKTRELHRKGRRKVPYPVIALVGYTNAGKSTLFNRLTGADVFSKDLLFATLDPTMRELSLPSGRKVILSDTVGFISDLPTHLIAAFRATLEEVLEADIILHVRDISHQQTEEQMNDVNLVLKQLGIDTENVETDIVYVWNKLDLLESDKRSIIAQDALRGESEVCITSAYSGDGLEELLGKVDEIILRQHEIREITIPSYDGSLLNWLYENAEIIERSDSELGDINCQVRVSPDNSGKLDKLLEQRKN